MRAGTEIRCVSCWMVAGIFTLAISFMVQANEVLPVHDAHIHYDQDVWQALPPKDAIDLLVQEGIERALVSATPTHGAAMLYRVAPERIIPMLRPYKSWRHRYLWFRDADLKTYLLQQLAITPYRGFGEFHVFGEDMRSAPVADMIQLASERGLVLHPHTDLKGMQILLAKAGDIPVMWAHGGFDVPLSQLRSFINRYENFHVELSLREGLLDEADRLTPAWRELILDHPDRFLVGVDTYKPSRWAALPELVGQARHWLAQLPKPVAEQLAYKNLDRLFPR